MKRLLFVLVLLSFPALAQAQSSCDKPSLTGTTVIFTPTFQFAVEIPAGITATNFKITVNGTQTALATTVGTPATNGNQCFLASVTVPNNGTNTVSTQYTPSGGTEKSSTPFALNLVDPVPVNHPR